MIPSFFVPKDFRFFFNYGILEIFLSLQHQAAKSPSRIFVRCFKLNIFLISIVKELSEEKKEEKK